MSIREEWKDLRPKLGTFISHVESLCGDIESIDDAIAKAEKRGYNKGFKEDKKALCKECAEHKFYSECNGYITPIRKWLALSSDSRFAITRLIDQMYKADKGGRRMTNEAVNEYMDTHDMTPAEAIERLQKSYDWVTKDGNDLVLAVAERVAIEALEKQIPKKPDVKTEEWFSGCEFVFSSKYNICPSCGYGDIFDEEYDRKYNFCPDCGQAIDWSDENEICN